MDDMLEFGKQVLASQPFSVHVGAELTEFSRGRAEIAIPVIQELKQQHGFIHGGVISYAADNAITFAGGSVLGPSVLTSEYKINYVKPAKEGKLLSRAEVIHSGKSQAVCRCEVVCVNQEGETLCAVAQGTISKTGKDAEKSY